MKVIILLCVVLICSVMSDSWQPQDSMGILQQEYWSGLPCPLPGDLPNPVTEPWFPTLQADSLPSEPPGRPKNTGVGSLSFLQGNFPTQESNRGLLHCWQILYQLSYMGSSNTSLGLIKCCMNNDTMLINFKECHHFYKSVFSDFMCL